MSFYLGPPSGRISLQNLERFAEKRLDFLIQIFKAKNDRVKLFDIVQDSVYNYDSLLLDHSVYIVYNYDSLLLNHSIKYIFKISFTLRVLLTTFCDIVQDSVNVTDSECLIDGSKKDGISHFILRYM
jgi:hypothetical protein